MNVPAAGDNLQPPEVAKSKFLRDKGFQAKHERNCEALRNY